MNATEGELDFRGLAGQVTEIPFNADDLSREITKKLTHTRYAWLTTVASTGMPAPALMWFYFDGATFTVLAGVTGVDAGVGEISGATSGATAGATSGGGGARK